MPPRNQKRVVVLAYRRLITLLDENVTQTADGGR
jgi:hypothetical protein